MAMMIGASRRLSVSGTASRTICAALSLGNSSFREVRDSFGLMQAPSDRLWGAQTQRSLQTFDTGRKHEHMPEPIIRAFGTLKKCVAKENLLHAYRGSLVCGNMRSWFSMNGNYSTFSTTGQVTEPSGEVNSATTADPDPPQRIKFKRPDKTARHIMNILDKEEVEKVNVDREFPDIRPGYIIELKVEVPENKRRLSTVKGIVIARRNAGLHSTFRLRRMVAGVGVESLFPLYSPNIKELKVLEKTKVRRAKLYYLRERMNPLKKKK